MRVIIIIIFIILTIFLLSFLVTFIVTKYRDKKTGFSQIKSALKSNDKSYFERYLEAENPINKRDHIGYTILMWAIQKGNYEITRFLLSKGADPEIGQVSNFNQDQDYIMRNPLSIAIEKRNIQIIKLLLSYDANTNAVLGKYLLAKGFYSIPLLALAIKSKNDKITELLLSNGSDPRILIEYHEEKYKFLTKTLLSMAIEIGKKEIVSQIVSKLVDGERDLRTGHLIQSAESNSQFSCSECRNVIWNVLPGSTCVHCGVYWTHSRLLTNEEVEEIKSKKREERDIELERIETELRNKVKILKSQGVKIANLRDPFVGVGWKNCYYCSSCLKNVSLESRVGDFCPHCGAFWKNFKRDLM